MTRKELLIQEAADYIARSQPRGLTEAKTVHVVENIEDQHSEVCGNIEDHLEKTQSPHKERFKKKYDVLVGSFAHHYENETGQEDEALGKLEELEQELKAHLGH